MNLTERIIDWVLPYKDYQNQLVDQASLMLTLSGRVTETNQVLASQTNFRLRCPYINIQVGENLFVNVHLRILFFK